MPKIVDPQQRRTEVIEAVFRIAERDGLEHASLRNIAAEAGLAIGSVRHYFSDTAQIMTAAIKELVERFGTRVLAHADRIRQGEPGLDRRAAAENLLAEFLPLDADRHLETSVWLSFVVASRHMPELRDYARELHNGTRMIIRKVLDNGKTSGRLIAGLDLDLETERLAALIDGLTLATLLQSELMNGEQAMAILRRHLDSLAEPGTGRVV